MDAGASRQIRTEITATDHCGFLRFTFPAHARASVVVEATRTGVMGFVRVDPAAREIVGYNPDRMDAHLTNIRLPNFKGYFVVRFDKPFVAHGGYAGKALRSEGGAAQDPNVGAYVGFKPGSDQGGGATVGRSFISIEQAREDLRAEGASW